MRPPKGENKGGCLKGSSLDALLCGSVWQNQ